MTGEEIFEIVCEEFAKADGYPSDAETWEQMPETDKQIFNAIANRINNAQS